jgi:hypothetical protein
MKTIIYTCLIFTAFSFCSCKSKPSKEDITKKILLEYVCPETAKVNDLKVMDTKETQSIFGLPALQYVVSGEVEWTTGCDEAFGNLPAGYKEKFDRKIVTLVKGEDGWQ